MILHFVKGKDVVKKVTGPFANGLLKKPLFWLVLITILGGCFRFYNLNWDWKHSFHPDERNILGQTSAIQAASGYKVGFFAYGQLPVYLYRATGELVSTPAFFSNLCRGNHQTAETLYWLLLAFVFSLIFPFIPREKAKTLVIALPLVSFVNYLLIGGSALMPSRVMPTLGFSILLLLVLSASYFLLPFLTRVSGLSAFAFAAFVFANFTFFFYFPLLTPAFSTLHFLFWLLLLGFLFVLSRIFLSEDNPALEISLTALIFVGFLCFKFFKIFSIWFGALEDIPVKAACFVLVALVSFGLSFVVSKFLEIDWAGTPMYAAVGATLLVGFLPAVLPVDFARISAVLAFALLVAGLLLWWAFVSSWGRIAIVFFAFFVLFASLNHGGRQYVGYGELMIVGRWWAAFFSTATIVAVYHLVQRIYQKTGMALLAAAGMAFAVVSIEQAHYSITESLITLMFLVVALASYEIIRRNGNWQSYLLAGGAFGISMAAKTSSLYYIFVLTVAHLIFLAKTPRQEWVKREKKLGENRALYSALAGTILAAIFISVFAFKPDGGRIIGKGIFFKLQGVVGDLFLSDPMTGRYLGLALSLLVGAVVVLFLAWGIKEFKIFRAQMPEWIKLLGAMGLAVLLFCLFSPWSLLDYQGFMHSQTYEWHVVSIADACYVLQFKNTLSYFYHLKNLMHVELWWPLGITAVLGMLWVLGRFLFRLVTPTTKNYLLPVPFLNGRGWSFSLPDLLLLAWFIPYFGFIGSWNTKFIRYMVPLVPVFCIFGAGFLTYLFEKIRGISIGRFLKPAILSIVLGGSFFYSLAYMHVYRFPHPWIEASVWIFKNIPQNSMILTEAWDDGLPTGVDPTMDPRLDRLMGPQNYRQEGMTIYEMHGFPNDNTPVKKNYYANTLQKGDYISIASKKLWYTLTESTPEFRPKGYNLYSVTSRYYRLLWSGLLGYKMVGEFHNFPSLFGWEHPDDMAEESFSVYDHPRVYLFKKVETVSPERILRLLETDDYVKGIDRDRMRTITPANVDAFIEERRKYLEGKGLLKQLEEAAPVTVSQTVPSPATPKSKPRDPRRPEAPLVQPTPEVKVEAPSTVPGLPDKRTLQALDSLAKNPVVENDLSAKAAPGEGALYQLRAWFSWLLFLIVLGWLALPLTLRVLSPIASGAYSLSKILGLLVFAWLVWFAGSLHLFRFTIVSCWGWLLLLTLLSAFGYWRDQKTIKALFAKWSRSWLIQEGAFVLAFLLFTIAKIYMSHIHDPVGEGYNGGGEAGMDYGFLASVVRGESFPPQNMWMAGLPIGYSFYYGHLIMGVVTKTLGLVPAVTYNLALITLFATAFSCAFGLAFALSGRLSSGWIAGLLCAAAGNPAGMKQILNALRQSFASMDISPFLSQLRNYDYWGPSRVIPNSINEFPYFSVLYGDMHAHTLSMPFAMLLIGVAASLYMGRSEGAFQWKKDMLTLLMGGFLLGAVAFLNSWEIPVWFLFIALTLLVRGLSGLNGNLLRKGLGMTFNSLVLALALLGWWVLMKKDVNPHALGGATPYLLVFGAIGFAAAILWLIGQKSSRVFANRFLAVAAGMGIVLAGVALLWFPFLMGFTPQQSNIMWVIPTIRTKLGDYFSIHGFFLAVILLSFAAAYFKDIAQWIGKPQKKGVKWSWDSLLDKLLLLLDRFVSPPNAVQGMLSLGVATLAVIWGASWSHWAEPANKVVFSHLLATAAGIGLVLAIHFRDRWIFWMVESALVLLWMTIMVLNGIHLFRDMSMTLNLGLFSVLWLLAFFHLGLAVKVFKNRDLSYSYLLVSFFFFVTATLEIFVMSEYFGFGDGMRNNSMFKYGIIAWGLASVGTGIFLPRILQSFIDLLRTVKKEAPIPRKALLGAAGVILFAIIKILLNGFFPSIDPPDVIHAINIVAVIGFLVWGYMEGVIKKGIARVAAPVVAGLGILLSFLPLLPNMGYGALLGMAQRWCDGFSFGTIFPVMLAALLLTLVCFLREGQRDLGRRLVFQSWALLAALLVLSVSVYPLFATWRKCHGFFSFNQRHWGVNESPTLNGLSFIQRANPGDAAAIRFLNERVPGQPCLVEFVGEGYNSWASRFSIFTGVPALMGWDGHVGEWVGRWLGADIRQRFDATEKIFRTIDTDLAKKVLDAYGVRLVMVGTVERNGVPGRKGGYPAEGLAKFQGFLPLIYKNPQVEIYYNPPPAN